MDDNGTDDRSGAPGAQPDHSDPPDRADPSDHPPRSAPEPPVATGAVRPSGSAAAERPREYRVEELAQAAGIPVRTLRFYRERRLLPPPRREGRIAWYSEDHLARLRTIAALLERGHTLSGIAELIAAWENGRTLKGVAELLGLEGALATPWSDETPVRLTPEQLADRFGGDVSPADLTTALDMGYIAVDGEEVVHISRRLLDASAALVHDGVPLAAVLAAGREVRHHVDALAELFTRIITTHVLGPPRALSPDDARRTSESLQRLRPLAKNIVDAEMALAMDRRVRREIDGWMGERTPSRPAGEGPPDNKQGEENPARDPQREAAPGSTRPEDGSEH